LGKIQRDIRKVHPNRNRIMTSPLSLPWWKPLPAPVLVGVMAAFIPLSVPAMTGLAVGATAFLGLKTLLD
jgi:hypothetical protein